LAQISANDSVTHECSEKQDGLRQVSLFQILSAMFLPNII